MGFLFIHCAMYYIASIVMGVLSLVIPFIKESLQAWCGRGKVGAGINLDCGWLLLSFPPLYIQTPHDLDPTVGSVLTS